MSEASHVRGRSNLRSAWGLSALLCLLPACDDAAINPETTAASPTAELHDVSDQAPAAAAMRMTVDEASAPGVATSRLRKLETPPSTLAQTFERAVEPETAVDEQAPLELRTARQRLTVRLAPDHRAPVRARIPTGESFEVFGLVEGRGCGGLGWASVGNGGFVCLARSRTATQAPRMMPPTRGGDVLPFYFAENRKGVPARRWSSMKSYLAGDEPRLVSSPGRDFAFVGRRREGGQIVLIDKRGRVMPERDLERYRPSSFEGRDLLAEPVPEAQQLAWAVDWPETTVRVAADPLAEATRFVDYHGQMYVKPEVIEVGATLWYELVDGGFVRARDIRRQEPVEALVGEDVAEDEIWVDVDIDQQVLTVVRGATPIYTTLISSGLKGPTPRGLFRINKKVAYGSMSSSPGASEAYAVEAVPYVQYIHEGIALHSAYWHDRFGFRISHGCINLSPRDARHVYSLTGPHARDGWMDVYEDEGDLGTRVRIHDGTELVADMRGPVEHVQG